MHEFRRGMKRCVKIASLTFSSCSNYICVSSNTETVHIFKIDMKLVEEVERQGCVNANENSDSTGSTSSAGSSSDEMAGGSRWTMGYFTKAMTSYLPSPVSDVLNQDRAFASVQLAQAGLRHQCVVTKLEKQTKVIVACEDGFLYIYDFDTSKGGECKLARAHDLRSPLDGITGKTEEILCRSLNENVSELIFKLQKYIWTISTVIELWLLPKRNVRQRQSVHMQAS